MIRVGVLIHDDVELLDFAGPAEVFAVARKADVQLYDVVTVAKTKDPIVSQGFLTCLPQFDLADCPDLDLLVIPGGSTEVLTQDVEMMAWLRARLESVPRVLTVCTGAFVPAALGMLDGLSATTWHGATARFSAAFPLVSVLDRARFVDSGKFVTTAGVSAGIDGALHCVAVQHGVETARAAARYIEYDAFDPDAGVVF